MMINSEPDYWEEKGIAKPQQYIVCAACKINEIIFCSARHFDTIMRAQIKAAGYLPRAHVEQGFIDQFGEFLSREDAMAIVKINEQKFDIICNGGSDVYLYSEGLY